LNGAFALGGGEFTFNRRDVHAAEIPAANGITNARSLARMYAACLEEVDGIRLLSPELVERARVTLTSGFDRCLMAETTFGLGFMTSGPFTPMLGAGSFGHAGAGGSLAFADPESGVGFGYVMNKMEMNLAGDPRLDPLLAAVRSCL
jgi:CubicO group peptidase (beta-lactamase class C family)